MNFPMVIPYINHIRCRKVLPITDFSQLYRALYTRALEMMSAWKAKYPNKIGSILHNIGG